MAALWGVPATSRPLIAFASIAWLAGLANISSWRGYIELQTLRAYATSLVLLAAPLIAIPRKEALARGMLSLNTVGSVALVLHVAIATFTVAFLYARLGVIVIRQDLRFLIPPALEYIVRSTLPLAMMAPVLARSGFARLSLAAAAVIPTLLVGSRGSVVIALAGYLVASSFVAESERARSRAFSWRLIGIGALSLVVVFGGFFARRSGNSQLAAVDIVKDAYFDYDGWWVYAAMPLHLGFREPAGLTNRIIVESITNDVNRTPLIAADLATVLPGEQLAAGQALGRIFGAVEAGGLTPGLLGGLFLDFGTNAVLGFALLGVTLTALSRLGSRSPQGALVFIVCQMQVLHLLHRGFLKPEYFTTLAIAAFYLAVSNPSSRRSVR